MSENIVPAKPENISSDIISKFGSIYFIGIGGISMSSLAMIAQKEGINVAGSDTGNSAMLDRLRKNGIKVYPEHRAEQIKGFDAVVYTAAIHDSNPELAEAKSSGVPLFLRAKFLGLLMKRYKRRIGVSGMHGKSTVTSMISHIFLDGGYDPTIVNGAECSELDGAYKLGSDEYFIFEACEYTDSFLSFFPTTAVILNIDMDHPDYFHSMEQIIDSYSKYASIADTVIINANDTNALEASNRAHMLKPGIKRITFGINNPNADYRAADIEYRDGKASFTVLFRAGDTAQSCRVTLAVTGEHNIYNALAAFAASHHNGVPAEKISNALSTFTGAKRRLEFKGILPSGAHLYDDYAHHPAEIEATLAAVKKLGYKHIYCVFQPHTYTRTYDLFDRFANAFSDADTVVFTDIYAARETNESGVSSEQLAKATPRGLYISAFRDISDFISTKAHKDDIVLTMGAGDVFKIGNMLLG